MMNATMKPRGSVGRFARDRAGTVGLMLAIMLPVLVLAMGAGVDFCRAMQAKAALQNAADAAALGTVLTFAAYGGLAGDETDAGTVASGYESSAAAVLPASVSSVTWSTPTYKASTSNGSGGYNPFSVSISVTGTVKTTLLAAFKKTISVTVTATAAVPVNDLAGNGNCNTSAADADSVFVFSVPPGVTGNYVPNVSSFTGTSSSLMYSQCANNKNYVPPATTSVVGFAFKNVTAANSNSDTTNCYNPGDSKDPVNNNQYGAQCQSTNWLFSTTWPPSLATTAGPGFISCTDDQAGKNDCTGSPGTYPGSTGTDNALQIYQMTGNVNATSGTVTEPTSGTTVNYNTNATGGTCVLTAASGSANYCTSFSSTTSQATTLLNYGTLDCSQHGGKTYMFFWNDMGGNPDDLDYNDTTFFYSCGSTANSTDQRIGYFAYLSQ